jgi:hypothetical protein
MDIVYSINGAYRDLIAYINTIIIYLKDFSGGLRENGQSELNKQLIISTRNVRDLPFPEARIPITNTVQFI